MTHLLRPVAAALLLLGLAACGGGDDADATADPTTTTVASTTTTDVAATAALDELIGWWNEITTGVDREGWVSAPIDRAAVVRGPSDAVGEIFAVRVNDGAVFGGRIEEGSVTSMFLGVDPDHESTASIVQMAMLRIADEPADIEQVARLYRDVALAPELRSEHIVAGADAAYVLAKIEGAKPDDRLMTVGMSHIVDPAAATERAVADRTEVLTLLADAE